MTAGGDWVLCWPSFLFNQFEMVFPAFDDFLTLHFPQFFGHICSFQIEIISKLLPVKGDVKFHGMFLQGNGIKIGQDPSSGIFRGNMKASAGKGQVLVC